MVDSPKNIINIQLGDILEIISPDNEKLNRKQFYVKYINSDKIILINVDNTTITTLNLDYNGDLEDKTINSIELLSRATFPGYAKQNDLVPGIWINIFFDGEIPFILTGEITDLEEDMIEIKSYPNNDILYIDFEFKGIPENLPIEKIVIRDPPTLKSQQKPDDTEGEVVTNTPPVNTPPVNTPPVNTPPVNTTIDTVRTPTEIDDDANDDANDDATDDVIIPDAQLKEILLDADQIQFGVELDEITQVVDVPESEMRFSIEKQTNDLLDELLSDIPNVKRTFVVLNDIHTMIERYKQLRDIFSNFDETGNANIPKQLNDSVKPIIKDIVNLTKKFHWLLPVSHNKKKLYDLDLSIFQGLDIDDIDAINFDESLTSENDIIEMYKNNDFSDDENKYLQLFKSLNNFLTPFIDPTYPENSISVKNVQTDILTLVNNLGDLYSSTAANEEGFIGKKQFLLEVYTRGLTYLKSNKLYPLTSNDTINIKSILTLPLPALLYSRIHLPTTNILKRAELNDLNFSYWKIFNKNTNIRTVVITEDDIKNSKSLIRTEINNRFPYNPIDIYPTEYILDEELLSQDNSYENFLNTILPNNIEFFNRVKKIIDNNVSVYSVIHFLELFQIYQNNITYDQSVIINKFVEEEINNYKQNFLSNYKKYNLNSSKKISNKVNSDLLQILSSNSSLENIIFDSYGFSKEINYSNSEVLNIILNIDYGRLFTIAIIKIDFDLQTTNLVDSFVKKYEQQVKTNQDDLKKGTTENGCGTIVKKYTDIAKLNTDSEADKEIYVDPEYNTTSEKILVKDGDYAIFIQEKPVTTSTVSTSVAPIGEELESLQIKIATESSLKPDTKKDILPITSENDGMNVSSTAEYYIRTNNKWVKDDTVNGNLGGTIVSPKIIL